MQTVPIAERFWEKVQKRGDNLCWEWLGFRHKNGYGGISAARPQRIILAHRMSWELEHGLIPPDICVCHKCDNRGCVNPRHLFLGTHKDNTQDMLSKSRNGDLRGENNGHAKLSEKDVVAIRSAKGTQKDIGMRFGVTQSQISDIKRRRKWAHVPDEETG